MSISGTEGLTDEQIDAELEQGAQFVVFEYCISIIIMTFKRSSDVHFVRAGESTMGKSIPYTLLSLVAGWWGFPWGPIYTFTALATNFSGGRNVTFELLNGADEDEY